MEHSQSHKQIPQSLILPAGPPMGVPCTRRRALYPAQNQTVGQNDDLLIYPSCGVPGVFLDPRTAYLRADVDFYNTNVCVDYCNFGPAGFGGDVFKKLSWVNQGQPLEEIDNYGVVATLLANINGDREQETYMYKSTKLKDGFYEDAHRNFIKPPMADKNGNIMYACNPVGLGYAPNAFQGTIYTTIGSTLTPMMSVKSRALMAVMNSSVAIVAPQSCAGVDLIGQLPFVNPALSDAQEPWLLNNTVNPTANGVNFYTPMDWPDALSSDQLIVLDELYAREYGTISKQAIMANLVNVKCFPIGVKPVNNPYITENYGVITTKTYQAADITTIGVCKAAIGTANNYTSSGNADIDLVKSSTAPTPVITWRLIYRLISGIFGTLSTKMLATCLFTPNQFYLKLTMAPNSQVFKLSSDPCRRITGTIRDYVRNTGTKNGYDAGSGNKAYGAEYFTVDTNLSWGPINWASSSFAPGYGPWLHIPMTYGTTAYTASCNAVFSPAACRGEYIFNDANTYTGTCGLTTPGSSANTFTVLTALSQGLPLVLPVGTIINAQGSSGTAGTHFNNGDYQIISWVQSTGTYTVAPLTGSTTFGAGTSAAITGVTVKIPYATGVPPTPQYVLSTTPWNYKRTGIKLTANSLCYANENQVFYGTYLTSSVPQSARIFSLDQWGNVNGTLQGAQFAGYTQSGNFGQTFYKMRNIYLVVDEITLEPSVANEVITNAAAGGMSVQLNSMKTFDAQLQANTPNQNVQVSVSVQAAKRIYFVFRNSQQTDSNVGWYYHSHCGYNPFVAVYPQSGVATTGLKSILGFTGGVLPATTTSTSTLYGVGYDTPLVVKPFCTDASVVNKSYQLQILSEYYPPLPLASVQEMIAEIDKCANMFGEDIYSPQVDTDIMQYTSNTSIGMNITSGSGSGTATTQDQHAIYNPFQPNRWTTPFISQHCLDDQTITQNADFGPLYSNGAVESTTAVPSSSWATGVDLSSYNGKRYLCPRGFCIPKMFTAPDSKAYIAIDLSPWGKDTGVDSWTFLGSNNTQLLLQGAEGLGAPGIWGNWLCTTVVPIKAVLTYMQGGVAQYAF